MLLLLRALLRRCARVFRCATCSARDRARVMRHRPCHATAFLELAPAIDFPVLQAGLRVRGIAANGVPGLMRVVTHHQVSAAFQELCLPMMRGA